MAQSAGERYSASGRGAAKGFQLPCGMRPPNSGQPLDEVGSGKTARLSVPLGVAGQDVDDDAAARAKDVQCRGSAGRVKSMACPESDTQGAFGHTVSPQTS